MREGSLFSGYNGLGMAVSQVFGSEPAWFSEIEPGPSKILEHHWPDVPNHGDITQIDWDAVEPVDILSGGFPCQDVSAAGKRAGLHPDTRSGLWNHMAYAISKLRPRYVVAENVRGLLSAEAHSDVEPCTWCLGDGPGEPALRALGAVLGDLADLGYDTQWVGLPASDVGAPHGRWREFILAWDAQVGGRDAAQPAVGRAESARPARGSGVAAADASHNGRERRAEPDQRAEARLAASLGNDLDGRAVAATHAEGNGRHEGRTEPARLVGRPDAAQRRAGATAWGQYAGAIRRWERVLGRTAPAPTELNTKGSQRLSPAFVEWMMGLPAGHVTAVPGVNRNAQLKALGNGVVPQQAEAALRMLHSAALEVAS